MKNLEHKGLAMVKNITLGIVLLFALLTLSACGGGTPTNTGYTKIILKINLDGDLGGKAIIGTGFSLTLPSNVTPDTVNGAVAAGVVNPSGTFADSTIAPIVTYIPATATNPGKMLIGVANSVDAGVTTVGEVATVTLQLTGGAALAAANFVLNSVPVSVIDTFGNSVEGMAVSVAGVTFL